MSWVFNRDNKTFFIAFLRKASEWTEMIFATGLPLDRIVISLPLLTSRSRLENLRFASAAVMVFIKIPSIKSSLQNYLVRVEMACQTKIVDVQRSKFGHFLEQSCSRQVRFLFITSETGKAQHKINKVTVWVSLTAFFGHTFFE